MEPTTTNTFQKFSHRYFAILFLLILMMVITTIALYQNSEQQLGAAEAINIAGKQRMLSQNLSQTALQMQYATTITEYEQHRKHLSGILLAWEAGHDYLLTDPSAQEILNTTSIGYNQHELYITIEQITKVLLTVDQIDSPPLVAQIQQHEEPFLTYMEEVVLEMSDASTRLARVERTIMFFLVVTGGSLLVIQGGSVFRPAIQELKNIWNILQKQSEELRESETLFRTMSDSSPLGIFLTDAEGNCTYSNERYQEISGLSAQEALGNGWSQAIHPDDRKRVAQEWEQSSQQQTIYQSEHRFVHPDGAIVWAFVRSARILDGNEVTGYVGGVQDDTDRHEALTQLQTSIKELDKLNQSMQEITQSTDLVDALQSGAKHIGTFLAAQYVTVSLFDEQKTGLQIYHSYSHPDHKADGSAHAANFETDLFKHLSLEEMQLLRQPVARSSVISDEAQPTVGCSLLILPLLAQDTVVGLLGIYTTPISRVYTKGEIVFAQNLANQIGSVVVNKQLHSEVRQMAFRYRNSIEASLDAFYLLESVRDNEHLIVDFQIVEINNNAVRQMGLPREQLLNSFIKDLFPAKGIHDFFARYKQVVQTGEPLLEEFRVSDEYPMPGCFYHQIYKVGDGIAIFNQDITLRKQAEVAYRASEAKKESVLNSMDDLVFVLDLDLRYIEFHASRGNDDLYISPDQFIGKRFTDMDFPEPAKTEIEESLVNCLTTHQLQRISYYLDMPNSRSWYDLKITPLADGNENIIGATGVVRDITAQKEHEAQLSDISQRLSSIITSTNVATWEWCIPTGKLRINERWANIIGYTLPELGPTSFETWTALVHPADLKITNDLLSEHFNGESDYYECEVRIKHKDGNWAWVLTRGKVTEWTEDGQPLTMMGTHQEITKRKQAEAQLRQSEEQFRSTVANASHGIVLIGDNTRFLLANEAFCQIVGYTQAELLDMDMPTLTHPNDAEKEKQVFTQLLHGDVDAYQLEKRFLHRTENEVWVLFSCALVHGTAENPDYMIGQAIDITERIQAEQAVKAYTNQLESLRIVGLDITAKLDLKTLLHSVTTYAINWLDGTGGGVYLYDPQRDSLNWSLNINTPYPQGMAVERGQGVGGVVWQTGQPVVKNDYANWEDHLETEGTKSFWAITGAPIKWGDEFMGVLLVTKNDSRKPFDLKDGELLSLLATQAAIAIRNARFFDEIQEARQAAEAANRAKSTFLSHMSHELRTPLNSILGFAQLHRHDANLTERQARSIEVIERGGKHLLRMINDILDLAKIDAGKVDLELGKCYLSTYLQSLMAMIAIQAEQRGLGFSYQLPACLPIAVQIDQTRLQQILLNLLNNAVKFTEQGEIGLVVSCLPDTDQSKEGFVSLRFAVRDTGIGIAQEHWEKLFDPFQQIGEISSQGTGLGLAISQQLARMMGSEIQMTSEPKKGSEFWFDLFVRILDEPVSTPVAEIQATHVQLTGWKPKVLVVDDDFHNRLLLTDWLQQIGFIIAEAENGQQAVTKAIEWQPDLILMDMQMPVLDGLSATRQLMDVSELEHTIVFSVSASIFEEQKMTSLASGCREFVSKPINLSHLWQLILKHFSLTWETIEVTEPSDSSHRSVSRTRHFEPTDIVSQLKLNDPDIEILEQLLAQIQKANVRHIKVELEKLAQLEEFYQPMVERLEVMIKQYQLKQMRQLVTDVLTALQPETDAP